MKNSQEKGEALRKRVVSLFNKTLPFEIHTIPKEGSKKEKRYYITPNKELFRSIDVSVENEKEVYLVIECKKLKTKPRLQDLADRLKNIKDEQKAKSGLLIVSGNFEITDEQRKDILDSHGIFLWDERLLSYYEKLASTLGEFSFFEIMKSLDIELEESSGDEYRPALMFSQNIGGEDLKMVSFTATPDQMMEKSHVFRHANKKWKSYQRLISKDKLNKISDYIESGGKIINSILVLLPEECKFQEAKLSKSEEKDWYYGSMKGEIGRLSLPKKYCFLEIIDGQHRLFSFTKTSEKTRKNFPLNFIGIQGGSNEIARDLFITVNQNAKKIEANLLASIQEEWDKENITKDSNALAREIVRKLNRTPRSSLKKLILEGERVTKSESKLKIYIAMLSYHGIRPLVKDQGPLKKLIGDYDVEKYYKPINKFLKSIEKVFPKEYQDTKKYVVFTNNGLIPLLRIFGDICSFYEKIPSKKQIEEIIKKIKGYRWDLEYIKGRSSGSGWKVTYDELKEKIRSYEEFKNF